MKHATARAIAVSLALAVTAVAMAGSIEPGDHLEMAAVLKSPISPTKAIQIAEAGGGQAYGYGMEANHSGHWYEVDVLRGGSKLLVKVNATTGKVIGSSAAHGEDAHGSRALDGTQLKFGEAIATAERIGRGPALEADAAGHGASAHVDVDIIQNQGKRVAHYRVSEQNGQMHAVTTGFDS